MVCGEYVRGDDEHTGGAFCVRRVSGSGEESVAGGRWVAYPGGVYTECVVPMWVKSAGEVGDPIREWSLWGYGREHGGGCVGLDVLGAWLCRGRDAGGGSGVDEAREVG